MRAALEHLAGARRAARTLAVLGDMAELGEHAERYHREVGELARELGIEVVAVGELARGYGADTWAPDATGGRRGCARALRARRRRARQGLARARARRGRSGSGEPGSR